MDKNKEWAEDELQECEVNIYDTCNDIIHNRCHWDCILGSFISEHD